MAKARSRTNRTSSKAKSKKDRLALIIVVGGFLFMGTVLGVRYTLDQANKFDEETLCPISGATEQTVVLIDKSDRWDIDDASRVRDLMTKIYRESPARSRLTVRAILGEYQESTEARTIFDKCNPGSEEQCSELYQSCGEIKRIYESSFESQLKAVIDELERPGQSSFSPLLETFIQTLDDTSSAKVTIHLVSDLMENGSRFRFYDVVPLAEEISAEYPIQMSGVGQAHLHIAERRRHSRQLLNSVQSVWEEYLEEQGIPVKSERLLIAD